MRSQTDEAVKAGRPAGGGKAVQHGLVARHIHAKDRSEACFAT
jgi:hypothetical protein